ncbi:3-keto-5-aminohexanoate cleavage protein [Micromonospora sp. NPDC048909]|uniref:3-keto-5-aminohexanoate cleavage protein n=1 Tax=Micromonospora sp. NPDC048909 TaxID=3155643 RepID=UPI0033E0EB70
MLKACLNGGRGRDEHPAVPLAPVELAADAARCAALGVAAVHVHPRDATGAESLRPDVITDALTAIRAARPGLAIGVSTGAWIEPDPGARVAAIRAWRGLPDFASVNAREEGAEAVAAVLHERGVMVEAGLWMVDAVAAYRRWRVPAGRILVECMAEQPAVALADAARILAALPAAGGDARRTGGDDTPPVLLHAEGPATWPVLAEAVRRGLHTRIGLEDTLQLPGGEPVADNAALVTTALAAGAH